MMIAIVPMAPPRASEPTSPMKISAGWALYQRKPMEAPTIGFLWYNAHPEETDGGSHHRTAEHGELRHFGHVLQFQVVGKNHVAADVGKHGERAGGDDCGADGQPVKAVGQINCVGRTDQHEYDKSDEGQKRQEAQMRNRGGPMPE